MGTWNIYFIQLIYNKSEHIHMNMQVNQAPTRHIIRCRFAHLLLTTFHIIGVNLYQSSCCVLASQHVPKYLLRASKPAVTTDEVAASRHSDTSAASVSKSSTVRSLPHSFKSLNVSFWYLTSSVFVCVFNRVKEKKKEEVCNLSFWRQEEQTLEDAW